MRIFVSYAAVDREKAEPIVMSLRAAGHEVFFDRDDLPPGKVFDNRIARAIRGSDAVVFCITPAAVSDGRYTRTELELTRRKWPNPNRRVVPVILEFVPIPDLPPYLRAVTILEPKGSAAAETLAAVDALGWRGLTLGRMAGAMAAISLIAVAAAAAAVFFRWWQFDCWTLSGFAATVPGATIAAISAILIVAIAWGLLHINDQDHPLGVLSRLAISRASLVVLAIIGIAAPAAAYAARAHLEPRSCLSNLESLVADHSWDRIEPELSRLASLPLRANIRQTAEVYAHSAARSAALEYPPTNLLRQDRAQILRLLSTNEDYHSASTIALANNSKSIFFQEDDTSLLDDAIEKLAKRLTVETRTVSRARLFLKTGEIELLRRNADDCEAALLEAANLFAPGPERSISRAYLGNLKATGNDLASAISLYKEAAPDYPEGSRFLFHSNFGYLYKLAGEYEAAIGEIQHAIKIKGDDWISHLNLALAYEEMERREDARHIYERVISDAPRTIDAAREARLLHGRNLEILGADERTVVAAYLDALDRSASERSVDAVLASPRARLAMYRDLAEAMRNVDTHGIDGYVEWFAERANAS